MKTFFRWSIYLLIILFAIILVRTFLVQRAVVDGSSMETTLSNGDSILVDKISYRFRDPARFDVVVFPFPEGSSTLYIKRIIGLPGEIVQIKDGVILINGAPLSENYGMEEISYPGLAWEGVTLGENEYFVLGDNRNNSDDSRLPKVGNISGDRFIGRAWIRILPFSGFGAVK